MIGGRALVVGASGHLGAHLTRVLLAQGVAVRALTRPGSNCEGVRGLALEHCVGDVLDGDSLRRAMRGCSAVFHLAAPTSLVPGIDRIIREGTRNVLDAARSAKIERLVYTSSIVTVGYSGRADSILDESSNRLTAASVYHNAKWHAEREVLDFSRENGLYVVVVNPATIVGALDYRITPSNAPIQRCLERGLPYTFDSGVTIVHAKDVARGHWLALLKGRAGERYILGGDRITIPDYFRLLCQLCDRPPPKWNVPRWLMLSAGLAFSAVRAAGWKRVPFTFGQARELIGKYGWYDSSKAVRELGYSWRNVEEAARDFIDWKRSCRESRRRAA
jgi:dihydroflavonol-4-reductase